MKTTDIIRNILDLIDGIECARVLAGSYIKLLPLGAIGANTVAGTWA